MVGAFILVSNQLIGTKMDNHAVLRTKRAAWQYGLFVLVLVVGAILIGYLTKNTNKILD